MNNVKSGCGCTVPQYTSSPILPGAEGNIKVEFNSKGKLGVQNRVITVTIVDGSSFDLFLTGYVN